MYPTVQCCISVFVRLSKGASSQERPKPFLSLGEQEEGKPPSSPGGPACRYYFEEHPGNRKHRVVFFYFFSLLLVIVLRLRPSLVLRPPASDSAPLWAEGEERLRRRTINAKTEVVEETNPPGISQSGKEKRRSFSPPAAAAADDRNSHSFSPVQSCLFCRCLFLLSVFFSNQGLGWKESNKPAANRLSLHTAETLQPKTTFIPCFFFFFYPSTRRRPSASWQRRCVLPFSFSPLISLLFMEAWKTVGRPLRF